MTLGGESWRGSLVRQPSPRCWEPCSESEIDIWIMYLSPLRLDRQEKEKRKESSGGAHRLQRVLRERKTTESARDGSLPSLAQPRPRPWTCLHRCKFYQHFAVSALSRIQSRKSALLIEGFSTTQKKSCFRGHSVHRASRRWRCFAQAPQR